MHASPRNSAAAHEGAHPTPTPDAGPSIEATENTEQSSEGGGTRAPDGSGRSSSPLCLTWASIRSISAGASMLAITSSRDLAGPYRRIEGIPGAFMNRLDVALGIPHQVIQRKRKRLVHEAADLEEPFVCFDSRHADVR